ncbi:glutaminase [Candidatus Curtissbacteria bacterium]|nr:glutaminase [Candidatus Curtissbacteria bacterium]
MLARTTLRIDADLKKRTQQRALEEATTQQEIFNKALEDYLQPKDAKKEAEGKTLEPERVNARADIIELIFSSLDIESRGFINKGDLIDALSFRGILDDDIRIKDVVQALNSHKDKDVPLPVFRKIVSPYITIIEKALTGSLTIPDFTNFCSFITNLYNRTLQNKDGEVSDYIPELKNVNPSNYAISICTVDGQRFNLGDCKIPYLAQSTAKAINYCLSLEEHGEEEVHKKIGRDPLTRGSDQLKLNSAGLPHNPLTAAGAIMVASLIGQELTVPERFELAQKKWKSLAGGIVSGFSQAASDSSKRVADKDLALAYFMRLNKLFPKNSNLEEYLDFLFNTMSIETTTEAQAVIAATLANGGVCPTNGEAVLKQQTTKNCLSFMYSCGMEDNSSEFAFSIGLPAKSGVSGSIMIVVPNVMGIAIYSPRVDGDGNSVKGLDLCNKLIQRFNFHMYDQKIQNLVKIDPRLLKNENKMQGVMAVCAAASQGDLYEVQRLEANGVALDEGDYDARTGMHLAAAEGHEEVVRYFIEKKVDVNPKDRWGGTPLNDAMRANHAKVVELLEKNGAKL